MSLIEITPATEIPSRNNGSRDRVPIQLDYMIVEGNSETRLPAKVRAVLPSRVAVLGNYLPR